MQWAEQLKEEYSKIAKKNLITSTGGKKPQPSTTLDEAGKMRTALVQHWTNDNLEQTNL